MVTSTEQAVEPGLQQALRQFIGSTQAGSVETRLDGGGHANGPGLRVRRFAVLPSAQDARWLMSLQNSSCARESWRIYTPFKFRAQVLKRVCLQIARTGWTGWARFPLSICSADLLPIEALVSDFSGEADPVFAVALGTPGRFRKLTVQAMRRDGTILGYLKLPLSASADARVRHEAAVLQKLRCFPELRRQVPAVLYAGEWETGYILFQSAGPAEPGPVSFGNSQREFLRRLQAVKREELPASALLEQVESKWRAAESGMGEEVRSACGKALRRAERELGGSTVVCGMAHGDFAPWNTRQGDAGLYVFDWESTQTSVPLGWDEFHFRVQVASLLNRKNALRPLTANREPTHVGSWLLYLVHSLCRCMEEGGSKKEEVELRFKLLGGLL